MKFKTIFFCHIMLLGVNDLYSQKLYIVPGLEIQYSGISYVKKEEKINNDFTPSKPKVNGTWGIDIYYQPRKVKYKVSFQREILGEAFGIKNKFFNIEKDLGIIGRQISSGIEHYVIGINFVKEDIKFRNFVFNKKIKFNCSIGYSIAFNRSNSYYRDFYSYYTGGRSDPYTYIAWEVNINKTGFGHFITGSGGVDVFSKKLNRLLCFSLFFNQGLKQMVKYDIHYQYGFFNDPQRQTDVPSQILRSRGTTFGFKLGVPIKILK